jgi:hypothetical protein
MEKWKMPIGDKYGSEDLGSVIYDYAEGEFEQLVPEAISIATKLGVTDLADKITGFIDGGFGGGERFVVPDYEEEAYLFDFVVWEIVQLISDTKCEEGYFITRDGDSLVVGSNR